MGNFTITNITSNGHAVYENTNGQFIYYWPLDWAWLVSSDYTTGKGYGAKSRPFESIDCPSEVTSWQVSRRGAGASSSSGAVIAKCTAPPTGALVSKKYQPPYCIFDVSQNKMRFNAEKYIGVIECGCNSGSVNK